MRLLFDENGPAEFRLHRILSIRNVFDLISLWEDFKNIIGRLASLHKFFSYCVIVIFSSSVPQFSVYDTPYSKYATQYQIWKKNK